MCMQFFLSVFSVWCPQTVSLSHVNRLGTTACCGSMDARTGFSYKAVAVAAATLAAGAFFVAFSAPSAEFHVGAEGSPHADASFSALAA